MQFICIANAALGKGLSGSDRIYIELAKRWAKSGHQVKICVWEEGYEMALREGLTEKLENVTFSKWFLKSFKNLPFSLNYVARIITGIYFALTSKYSLSSGSYIYACSDFWQDVIPALILKNRYNKASLIGSYYLAAPNPFIGYKEKGNFKLPTIKGIIYFLLQQPIYILLKTYANYIFVTSEPDIARFPSQSKKNKVYVVKGGVDLEKINQFKKNLLPQTKEFDAVFQGRFHDQKGILELIEIWKKVTNILPNAKLVMIGDGPLMNDAKEKIIRLNLSDNITLTGYMFDGEQKYKIFAQSKIAVHPAVYDSGGMAVAEAMAWDIPAISFDLEALQTYYPKGMLKVPIGNLEAFAEGIIKLLKDSTLYESTKNDSIHLIKNYWDWNQRADDILKFLAL